MRKIFLIYILCVLSFCLLNAQTHKIDSLVNLLDSHSQKDTSRVNALNSLALELQNIDLYKAKDLLEEAQEISVQINYPRGLANSIYNLGFYYWNKGNYDTALIICNRALSIFKSLNLKEGQIKCYNRIAVIHLNTGNYKTSIENYYKSLELCEETGNYTQIGRIYNNLGVFYGNLNDYDKAIEYNYKALDIKEKLKDSFSIGISINNIGYYNLKAGNFNDAYKYLHQSLIYNTKINNNYILGITYQNLGNLFDNLNNYDSAFIYHQKGLELLKDYGSQGQFARSYYLIGNHYLLQNDFKRTIEFAEKSLNIATKTNEKDFILNSYDILFKAYNGLSDYKNAFNYLSAFNLLNEELKKDENIKRLAVQEKELEMKLQKEKTNLEIENYKKEKLIILIALIFTIILILLIIYILIQNIKKNKSLRKANETREKMFKIISHDFRSPLISISNTLQLIPNLIKEKDYESAIRLSTNDVESVSRVLSLIDNLISWTLSQNDDIPYKPEKYNLNQISQFIFDLYTPVANYKSIELNNNIPNNLEIYADKNILNTVLRNLINNALKYTSENGKITVFAEQDKNAVTIFVSDTGIGIPKDQIENIFSLTQEKRLGTKQEKGNGLGLFFCKEFVSKNKGSIWVESKVDKGSTFCFTVPAN